MNIRGVEINKVTDIAFRELGSCMAVAEFLTRSFLENGIHDFGVSAGYVQFSDSSFDGHQHTWIEINGKRIDPSKVQFSKWGFDYEAMVYMNRVKRKYTPEHYLILCDNFPEDFAKWANKKIDI